MMCWNLKRAGKEKKGMTSVNSYFLDTSFLIDLVRGNENAIELYEGIGNNWATGAITIYELSKFGKKDYEKIFSAKPVFPFDLADSETSGDIYKELKREGALISEMYM